MSRAQRRARRENPRLAKIAERTVKQFEEAGYVRAPPGRSMVFDRACADLGISMTVAATRVFYNKKLAGGRLMTVDAMTIGVEAWIKAEDLKAVNTLLELRKEEQHMILVEVPYVEIGPINIQNVVRRFHALTESFNGLGAAFKSFDWKAASGTPPDPAKDGYNQDDTVLSTALQFHTKKP